MLKSFAILYAVYYHVLFFLQSFFLFLFNKRKNPEEKDGSCRKVGTSTISCSAAYREVSWHVCEHEGSVTSSVFAASGSVASQTGLAKVKI